MGRPRSAPWVLLFLLLPLFARAQDAKPGLLELTDTTFHTKLKELPEDRWVLMEFYAHWCPACQRFQPEYEKVAAYFGVHRADQQPLITVARLDCANYADVCSQFNVAGYPTMRFGSAADLDAVALDKLVDVRPASRKFDSVVAFLGKELDVKFDVSTFDMAAISGGSGAAGAGGALAGQVDPQGAAGAGGAGGGTVVKPAGDGGSGEAAAERSAGTGGGTGAGAEPAVTARADLNDIEGATIKSWEYITASPQLLKGPDARQALKDWVDLLADNHPVPRCQAGAEKLQEALHELWPDDSDVPEKGLQALQICPGAPFKRWASCASSLPDRRGYTCALWQLFHTLASRLPESQENAGAIWMAAVKGYVGAYFQCSECAKHFMRHATAEEAASVARKRDAVLWMWKAHNIVNRRLGSEEEADSSKGDPAAPHVQFPPATLCPQCRKAEGMGQTKEEAVPWNEDAVYDFLVAYYSGEAPAGGAAEAGQHSRQSSWSDAGLLLVVVAGCVYGLLRSSGQYALRKSTSRTL